MSNGTTIAIETSALVSPRRIVKIVPYPAGGFAVTVPYHTANQGFLAKVPVDYKANRSTVGRPDLIERYHASDRVKLSYHKDGFVQFSGENPSKILSGRDSQTLEPKGLGLVTQPPSDPIKTGPSFVVIVWGLDEFESLPAGKSAEVFTDQECYERDYPVDDANGWLVEGFVFPRRFWAGVRNQGGRRVTSRMFRDFEASGAVLEMRVIDLPRQPSFLALLVSRLKVEYSCPSGFNMGGPGVRRPDDTGTNLIAVYPSKAAGGTDDSTSLDFARAVIL